MSIIFRIALSDRDWDADMGGWRCPALRIPGAKIDAFFVSGQQIDSGWYQVLTDLALVRWAHGHRPSEAAVVITLVEELSTRELTVRWKKLAILLPFISALLGVLIAGSVAVYNSRRNESRHEDSAHQRRSQPTVSSACGSVKITYPLNLQATPATFAVTGCAGDLPTYNNLWIFTTDRAGAPSKYWPQEAVAPQPDGTWRGQVYSIGDDPPGTVRSFGVFLVGPNGSTAIANWKKRADARMAMTVLTDDIHMCGERQVVMAASSPP